MVGKGSGHPSLRAAEHPCQRTPLLASLSASPPSHLKGNLQQQALLRVHQLSLPAAQPKHGNVKAIGCGGSQEAAEAGRQARLHGGAAKQGWVGPWLIASMHHCKRQAALRYRKLHLGPAPLPASCTAAQTRTRLREQLHIPVLQRHR